MKITEIQCFAVFNGARNNLFVTVDTDAGIEGVGESGLSGRELAVMGAIEHFKPLLIGQDATRIDVAHLANALSRRLLSGQPRHRQRNLRHRHRPVGHSGQGAERKADRLPSLWRPGAPATGSSATPPRKRPTSSSTFDALVDNCRRHVAEG